MVGAAGNRIHLILPRVQTIKGIFLTRIYTSEFRVRTALITLRHSRSLKPARILSSHTPERSQGCRATVSAISRWSQSRPFCCFWPRKWTWLTHPRCSDAHKKKFGCLSKYSHLPKIFCGAESAGTYLYQSSEQHSERHIANIVFLRPRVSLAVGRKAPAAR